MLLMAVEDETSLGAVDRAKTEDLPEGDAFQADCRVCGKKGHKDTDCWENPANKDKHPSFYKSPNQHSNSGGKNTGTVCGHCNKGSRRESMFQKEMRSGQ
jgi:hypothetical protein